MWQPANEMITNSKYRTMKMILTTAIVLICSIMLFSAPTLNHNAFSYLTITTQTALLQPVSPDNGQEENKGVPSENKIQKPEGTKELKPAESNKNDVKNAQSDFKLLQRGKKVLEHKYHLYA